jgi:hypothetical protein
MNSWAGNDDSSPESIKNICHTPYPDSPNRRDD